MIKPVDSSQDILELRAEIKRLTEKLIAKDEELTACQKKLRRTEQRLAIIKEQRNSYMRAKKELVLNGSVG